MPVLKFYSWSYAAGGCGLIAMVLAEKQIPFELVLVDMAKGDHKTPEYVAKHPFGQVPMIDDDGFILYESRAICRYLAEKYADRGTPLIPTSLPAKALFEQAASIEFANFHPLVGKIMLEAIYKMHNNLPPDEAVLTQAKSDLAAKLDVYEVILSTQNYLGGNEFTLADLFHLAFAPSLAQQGHNIMADRGPNVTRWWNDVSSRPSWVKLQADGIPGIKSTM
ncbi:glutathione S-transferase [Mycena belliarum]|uniref:glutathione transferase n=1 Tax=Mycena belliarum TaxID=1033014 RepID=A0AAD6UIV9_9AGAR|nr:glutathione S-transferase [Mycena belliae]